MNATDDSHQSSRHAILLPNEVLTYIFEHLSPIELSKVAQSSRSLHRVATAPSLWEQTYLSFWREENWSKSRDRGTASWRDGRRIQYMYRTAKRIWRENALENKSSNNEEISSQGQETDSDRIALESKSPFPKFLSAPSVDLFEGHQHALPNFYKLFCERICIDDDVLKRIQAKCFEHHGWLEKMIEIYDEYGDDIKDLLHALITVQRRFDPDSGLMVSEVKDGKEEERPSFSSAYELRMPYAKRSRTHHLSLLHLAKQFHQYIQHQEAVCGLNHIRDISRSREISEGPFPWTKVHASHFSKASKTNIGAMQKAKVFENSLCYLSMFLGGEGNEIVNELDMLAVACSLYLAKERISLEGSGARRFAQSICKFMQNRGFRGARNHLFHRLDNNFIHLCLDESGRESLPLTLVVIFCALSNRLGLSALPTNTPGRLLAIVSQSHHSSDGEKADPFWISAADDGFLYELSDLQRLFRMNSLDPDHTIVSAATPLEVCLRASRNIFNGLQSAHMMANFNMGSDTFAVVQLGEENGESDRDIDQIFEKTLLANDNIFNPRRIFLRADDRNAHLVSTLYKEIGSTSKLKRRTDSQAFLATAGRYQEVDQSSETKAILSMFAAANAMTELSDEADRDGTAFSTATAQQYLPIGILSIQSGLQRRPHFESSQFDLMRRADLESMKANLLRQDLLGRSPKTRSSSSNTEKNKVLEMMHPVGTIFVHRVYRYHAIIQDWDKKCDKGEDWISAMDVDDLPNGGREQPFYTSLVNDGSVRYVAHCNILPAVASSTISSNEEAKKPHLSQSQVEKLINEHDLGDIFRCASATSDGSCLRLLLNATGEHIYPDDSACFMK